MKAGRELDKMIAEKVLGIKVIQDCEMTRDRKWQQDKKNFPWILELEEYLCFFLEPNNLGVSWNPSTDIKDAWMVVEKLHQKGWAVMVNYDDDYLCEISGKAFETLASVMHESAPMAICSAALKAVR